MAVPLLPLLLLGSSLGSQFFKLGSDAMNRRDINKIYRNNLYSNHLQRDLYSQQLKAVSALDAGYRKHLASEGKTVNPNRAWSSYFGQVKALQNRIDSLDISDSNLGTSNSIAMRNNSLSTWYDSNNTARSLYGTMGYLSRRL